MAIGTASPWGMGVRLPDVPHTCPYGLPATAGLRQAARGAPFPAGGPAAGEKQGSPSLGSPYCHLYVRPRGGALRRLRDSRFYGRLRRRTSSSPPPASRASEAGSGVGTTASVMAVPLSMT